MARRKTADQSGLHLSYGTADKAVDGNTNPSMDAKSCIHAVSYLNQEICSMEYVHPGFVTF